MSKSDSISDTLNQIYRQIYPDTQMQSEVIKLQDQLEEMHLQILDLNEARQQAIADCKAYADAMEAHRIARKAADGSQARCTSLETDLRNLKEDHTVLQKNYQHLLEINKNRDATFRDAMRIMGELREKCKKGEEYKSQAEHLARQTVRLHDKNTELETKITTLQTDYVSLMATFKEVRDRVPELILENDEFRKQTVRLVNDRSLIECPAMREGRADGPFCGNCITCQLKQTQETLAQTTANLEKCQKERDEFQKQAEKNETDLKEAGQLNNRIFIESNYFRNGLVAITKSSFLNSKKIAKQVIAGENKFKIV